MPNKNLINEVLKPVVRVNTASGLLVYSKNGINLVLTNAHVVENLVEDETKLADTEYVQVDRFDYDEKGKKLGFFRCDAEIVAYDRRNDLAMLRLRDERTIKTIANLPKNDINEKISLFDEIIVVGCSLSDFPVPTKGIISCLDTNIHGVEYWMTSAPIVEGNSGGGCFIKDKTTYKLIGISTAVCASVEAETEEPNETFSHLNYIVPPDRMTDFVAYVVNKLKKSDS